MQRSILRGDIYYANLTGIQGSEQGGFRPVLVLQNNTGNKYSPTVIVAAITSSINKTKLPTHIKLGAKEYGLKKDSIVLCEQMRTIDKKRLCSLVSKVDEEKMYEVENALAISFGMTNRLAV